MKNKILFTNDANNNNLFLYELIDNLKKCESFSLCVAFLTDGAYRLLYRTFEYLQEKSINGTIIVSEYQHFTQPVALKNFLKFKNIDLRIIMEKDAIMHAKGYIFENYNSLTAIIGSSNLTTKALTHNKEWNLKAIYNNSDEQYNEIKREFDVLKKISIEVTDKVINEYEKNYKQKRIEYIDQATCSEITPNNMQIKAIDSLNNLRNRGQNKALVISSTGTGKTYMCAFDIKQTGPKKLLFVVHREQIAKSAVKAFQRIIKNKKIGILDTSDVDKYDYTFCTVQTLSREKHLSKFQNNYFDYIIFDEVHRLGAETHRRIYNYFTPKFLLGMTATPERTDGFNIYEMFDYNIAYEIRLQEAIKEELICPFHYYGVSDFVCDGELISDKSDFNKLIERKRVDHIIEKINYYGFNGERVKGLIFVSRNEESDALSKAFNARGYRTVSLTGASTQKERETAVNMLEKSNRDEGLDYIFTVDIFNEGVDIPAINQIVMLRPTQSAIIFTQQIGRGLRKSQNKEYVVLLDFIGNYENNFLIPVALSGSRDKEQLRKWIQLDSTMLSGASTVNFEKVIENQIYTSLDNAKFNQKQIFKSKYNELKAKLGRIPLLSDFDLYSDISSLNISLVEGSYHNFLVKYDKDYNIEFSVTQMNILELVSTKYLNGKRPHEMVLLEKCINNPSNFIEMFKTEMKLNYNELHLDNNAINCVLNQFDGSYFISSDRKKFKDAKVIVKENGTISLTHQFIKSLQDTEFKNILLELISITLKNYESNYKRIVLNNGLALYKTYSYEETFRILGWQNDEIKQNIGGYKYNKKTNTLPVFINYDKDEHIEDSVRYYDRFLDNKTLIAISKNNRTTKSPDLLVIKNSEINNTKIELFVRKNKYDKDDKGAKGFYYLGQISPSNDYNNIVMDNKKAAVEIKYNLAQSIEGHIYEYLVN